MRSCILVAVLALLCGAAVADKCAATGVSTYSTQDSITSKDYTVFLATFGASCNGKAYKDGRLHAVVAGSSVPIAVVDDGASFQVSWKAPHSETASGAYDVHVFTDSAYAEYRKAVRDNTALPAASFVVPLNHPGVSNEALLWPQYAAVATLIAVFYFAHKKSSAL